MARPTEVAGGHDFAFVAQWEFACCGTPLRIGAVVEVFPTRAGDGDVWDSLLPVPAAWIAGHHDVGYDLGPTRSARVVRISEAWAPLEPIPHGAGLRAAAAGAHLIETDATSPHEGSEDAVLSPVPSGVRPGEEHWGWVLQIDLLR